MYESSAAGLKNALAIPQHYVLLQQMEFKGLRTLKRKLSDSRPEETHEARVRSRARRQGESTLGAKTVFLRNSRPTSTKGEDHSLLMGLGRRTQALGPNPSSSGRAAWGV